MLVSNNKFRSIRTKSLLLQIHQIHLHFVHWTNQRPSKKISNQFAPLLVVEFNSTNQMIDNIILLILLLLINTNVTNIQFSIKRLTLWLNPYFSIIPIIPTYLQIFCQHKLICSHPFNTFSVFPSCYRKLFHPKCSVLQSSILINRVRKHCTFIYITIKLLDLNRYCFVR